MLLRSSCDVSTWTLSFLYTEKKDSLDEILSCVDWEGVLKGSLYCLSLGTQEIVQRYCEERHFLCQWSWVHEPDMYSPSVGCKARAWIYQGPVEGLFADMRQMKHWGTMSKATSVVQWFHPTLCLASLDEVCSNRWICCAADYGTPLWCQESREL